MLSEAFGITLIRVVLGIILLTHGYVLKIVTFTIAGPVGYFQSVGFPAIVASLMIAGEILGDLALLISGFTRLAALLSILILLGSTWMHLGNNWVISEEGGGWEFHVLLVILEASTGLVGADRYAVDNLA